MTRQKFNPVCMAAALLLLLGWSQQSFASFHFMQIEQVIGGVNGDVTAQAIQLRLRGTGQNQMQFSRIRAWDATGSNPVIIVDMASPVANFTGGSRVLIATSSFLLQTTPTTTSDFIMTNPIPASYLAAGKLTFEDDSGATIYWALAWGGAAYTGTNVGSPTNDSDGNFNPPFPSAMPSGGLSAVRFPGAFSAQSTTNLADYTLSAGAATFTNNAGSAFVLSGGACCIAAGQCIQTTLTGCGAGVFQGPGTVCGPGSCPMPTSGSCCCGSSCTNVAGSDLCTSPGGGLLVSFVAGGNCNPFSVVTPCCRADFNRSGGSPSPDDIFNFLAAFFSPTPTIAACADTNGVGGAAPTPDDIFGFLAAFFRVGGCTP